MGLLDGRVVIVTGGGRGLGRSHCLELAAQGAHVVVNDLGTTVSGDVADGSGESPAVVVAREIAELGGVAVPDSGSVTDPGAVEQLVGTAIAAFGRVDAIVNNAGILRDRAIVNTTDADWDTVIGVHLKGTFLLTREACRYWRQESKSGRAVAGRIINTTSGTGLFGNPGQASYGAAKAGIANLTTIAAMEMERYGVTANAISPVALTRMTDSLPQMVEAGADQSWNPFDPANASPVVAWLASTQSGWLNGAVLRVSGHTVSRVVPWTVDPRVAYQAASGQRLAIDEIDSGLRTAFGLRPEGLKASS